MSGQEKLEPAKSKHLARLAQHHQGGVSRVLRGTREGHTIAPRESATSNNMSIGVSAQEEEKRTSRTGPRQSLSHRCQGKAKEPSSICQKTWSVRVKVRGKNIVEKQTEHREELRKGMMAIPLRLSIKNTNSAAEDEFHKVKAGNNSMEKAIEENLLERRHKVRLIAEHEA